MTDQKPAPKPGPKPLQRDPTTGMWLGTRRQQPPPLAEKLAGVDGLAERVLLGGERRTDALGDALGGLMQSQAAVDASETRHRLDPARDGRDQAREDLARSQADLAQARQAAGRAADDARPRRSYDELQALLQPGEDFNPGDDEDDGYEDVLDEDGNVMYRTYGGGW